MKQGKWLKGIILTTQLLEYVAWTYLQLPLQQWDASSIYLLVLSNWKVNIDENHIAVMGL